MRIFCQCPIDQKQCHPERSEGPLRPGRTASSSWPTRAASCSTSPVPPPCSARPTRRPRGPVYDLRIVSPDGGAVASNAGVAIESRRIGGQPDTLLVAGGSLGLKAVMARAGRAALALQGGAQGAALRLGLHRRLRAGGRGASGRQAGGDALGELRSAGRRVSPRSRSTPIRSTSSTARCGPRPASPPASTWRWPWSRPTSARPPPT